MCYLHTYKLHRHKTQIQNTVVNNSIDHYLSEIRLIFISIAYV